MMALFSFLLMIMKQANLRIMCDEIFGEDNFVVNAIWETGKNAEGMKTQQNLVF